MQSDYGALREIEIDMQFAKENETYQMPDPKQYGKFHKSRGFFRQNRLEMK